MARTLEEIDAAARALDEPGKPHPELPLVLTSEEAALLVGQLRSLRSQRNRKVPDHAEMMKKVGGGKTKIHGHVVEVKD